MGFDQPSHWLIVIAVAVVLFGGYKKLPEAARSVGRSLRIFKTEMKGLSEDDAAREAAKAGPAIHDGTPIAPGVPTIAGPVVATPAADLAPADLTKPSSAPVAAAPVAPPVSNSAAPTTPGTV